MKFYLKTFLLASVFVSQTILTSALIYADVNFDIIGDGFHRTFNYEISINGLNESDCAIALHISLPPEIYVNVDEIADLKRLGKAVACSVGEIDVELFSEKAKNQNVTICEDIKLCNSKSILLSLPVHQRYKISQYNEGYVTVDIPKPILLIGCKERLKDNRVSKINLCSPCTELANKWREISYNEMESFNKVWKIPVGNLSHLSAVSYITLFVTSIAAAIVLKVIFNLKRRFDEANEKED